MNRDINVGYLRTHCYRQSKVPGEFMLQMRVPGGVIDAKYLSFVQHIAETWGNGIFHFGTRQTFDFPGIHYDDIPAVNEYIESYIRELADASGVDMDLMGGKAQEWDPAHGYPSIGARNVTACIGNAHCIMGQINTQEIAREVERLIYPSHNNIKVNISGCPNDCNKAHLCDFGIIGCSKIVYHNERCIGCATCVRQCQGHSTRVLSLNDNGRVDKDTCCCVGCGECARVCPTSAWTRRPEKFYKVILGGRTGRQTPRLGKMFLNWASKEVVLGCLANWQKFAAWALDNQPLYLHGGHLIDRAGYQKFKEIILDGVQLNPECLVADNIFWHETEYRSNFNVKDPNTIIPAGPAYSVWKSKQVK